MIAIGYRDALVSVELCPGLVGNCCVPDRRRFLSVVWWSLWFAGSGRRGLRLSSSLDVWNSSGCQVQSLFRSRLNSRRKLRWACFFRSLPCRVPGACSQVARYPRTPHFLAEVLLPRGLCAKSSALVMNNCFSASPEGLFICRVSHAIR